jgi:5'-phosphate synthase pdxT subunit
MTNIGVLALQGDFKEHVRMLRELGAVAYEVRRAEQLLALDGLIIPGGESTTIARLAKVGGLWDGLRDFVTHKPTWGTCAGAILLAKDIEGEPAHLAAMDIGVRRNAFGRQIDSFIAELPVRGLEGGPLKAVFIRAPIIAHIGPGVQTLARLDDGTVVAARQGHLLATAFHPELTPDTRLHAYFLGMTRERRAMV